MVHSSCSSKLQPGADVCVLSGGGWYNATIISTNKNSSKCIVRYADNGEEESSVDIPSRVRERSWLRVDARVAVRFKRHYYECKVLRISSDGHSLTVRYEMDGYAEEDVDVKSRVQPLPSIIADRTRQPWSQQSKATRARMDRRQQLDEHKDAHSQNNATCSGNAARRKQRECSTKDVAATHVEIDERVVAANNDGPAEEAADPLEKLAHELQTPKLCDAESDAEAVGCSDCEESASLRKESTVEESAFAAFNASIDPSIAVNAEARERFYMTLHYCDGGSISTNAMELEDTWLLHPCSALKLAFVRRCARVVKACTKPTR